MTNIRSGQTPWKWRGDREPFDPAKRPLYSFVHYVGAKGAGRLQFACYTAALKTARLVDIEVQTSANLEHVTCPRCWLYIETMARDKAAEAARAGQANVWQHLRSRQL